MPNKRPEKIDQVVAECPELAGAHSFARYIDRRGEGVWRVSKDGGDFAIRFRQPSDQRSLEREFNRMAHATGAQIAPVPVGFSEQNGWLVAEWVEGEPINPLRTPTARELACAASACARLHALEPFGGTPADLGASLQSDLERLGAAANVLPEGFAVWRDHAFELARRLSSTAVVAPCHNDLFPANVIVGKAGCKLIDWEYAADNDPAYDIAAFAVCASLGVDNVEPLLGEYLGCLSSSATTPMQRPWPSLMRVRGWMLVAAVSWLPWALADDTMPPLSRAIWTDWARHRYENITASLNSRDCDEMLESCG